MSQSVRVRFAPSPTGKLHVGGARTAIYNWAFARAQGGTFILRIDDTDPERSTDENIQIIKRAMDWLGLTYDEGPDVGGAYGPYRQTERHERYQQVADQLLAEGKAYYCFCTPEELARDREEAQQKKSRFQGYQRRCRHLTDAEVARRLEAGDPYVIRIKVPEDRGDVIIDDLVHGRVVFSSQELDDFVIMRSDHTPTYNFATVVDDADMCITHVIRGDDHLSNTPRQVIVYEALGAPTPAFAHISMILGADGKKLSKRHGATNVEEYRDAGYLSEAFVNYLSLLGWSLDDATTIIPRKVLAEQFSLERVSKNPATFDPAKLDWINAQYLNTMDLAAFAREVVTPQLIAHAHQDLIDSHDESWLLKLSEVLQPRCKKLTDVCEVLEPILVSADELEYDPRALEKAFAHEDAEALIQRAYELLDACEADSWNAAAIDEALAQLEPYKELKKKVIFQTVRVALCGRLVSPPLGETVELIGKEDALKRLQRARTYTHPQAV